MKSEFELGFVRYSYVVTKYGPQIEPQIHARALTTYEPDIARPNRNVVQSRHETVSETESLPRAPLDVANEVNCIVSHFLAKSFSSLTLFAQLKKGNKKTYR